MQLLKILPFIVFFLSLLIMNHLIKKSELKLSSLLFVNMASSIKLGRVEEKISVKFLCFLLPVLNAGSVLGILGVVYILV